MIQTTRPRISRDGGIPADLRPNAQPFTLESLVIHRATLRRDMLQRKPLPQPRVGNPQRIHIVRVGVIRRRPLKIGQTLRLRIHAPLTHRRQNLTVRHPRRRSVNSLRIIGSRNSRHQRSQLALLQRIRLIKNQRIRSQTATRPMRPSQKPQRPTIIQNNTVLRVPRIHLPHHRRQLRRTINPAAQTQKRRLGRLQLMRRPNNVTLFQQKQASQSPSLKNHALTLLARHHHAHLWGREPPIQALPKHPPHHVLLPRVQHQPHSATQRHSVVPKVRVRRSGDKLNPRPLSASRGACW